MAFSSVPLESKSQINRAGEVLAKFHLQSKVESKTFQVMTIDEDSELEHAWDLAARWRACHAYPINTFQSTLRTKTKELAGDPIVAQRLKRMPTIIDKLARYPSMTLSQMQDIGGIRAILSSVAQAEKLAADYCDNANFEHEL